MTAITQFSQKKKYMENVKNLLESTFSSEPTLQTAAFSAAQRIILESTGYEVAPKGKKFRIL